jgi:peptidyl-prolyl cis-trans isomerase D
MATLNKLRNSKWVLVIVLLSLGLFVTTDYFSNSNKYSISDQEVGEIDGHEISLQEFDAKYKEIMEQLANNGMTENEETKVQAASYAWNQFIQQFLIDKEYEKLGIDISVEEASELLYSENAHPTIRETFSSQYLSEDGVFRPSAVVQIKNRAKKDAKIRAFFENLVRQVMADVMNKKYTSLLSKSVYATSLDAEDDFYASSTAFNGKSVSLFYTSIDDKTIKTTDEELKAYIKKHKGDFKQVESRDLEYILINIAPSKEDTMAIKEELEEEISSFATTEDDSLYTVSSGIVPFTKEFKTRGTYNKDFEAQLFSSPKDSVVGPFYYDGGYSLFKITDSKDDSMFYYHVVKAEVPVKGTTLNDTLEAMALARKIGAESASSANSLDFFNSKTNTGELSYAYDLGWIKDGSQQDEVNKALKTLGPGQSTVVKAAGTGVSIIKLVEPKSNRLIQVAEVRHMVTPLKSTEDAAFQKAFNFRNTLGANSPKGEFEAKTKKAGIAKSVANNVKPSDRTMSGLPGTLDVVRWAFGEDRKEGDNSDVISSENLLIVAHLVRIKEEGTAEVDDVREKVTKLVINEKKAEILKANFDKALKAGKTIEDVAAAVKSTVQPLNSVTFYNPNIQFAGNDPKLVGFVCGLKAKELSKPIVSTEGVHVFYIESVNKPEAPENDLKSRKQQLYGQRKQQIYNMVYEGLKKHAKVKDERYKYY